jgi:hypothetical protein
MTEDGDVSTLKPKNGFTPGPVSAETGDASKSLMELRASVRFPVRMHVKVQTENGRREDAETINVSASGVLLAFSRALDEGSTIEVEMVMPSKAMGTPQDVVVHCHGRVIRSYRKSPTQVEIATVIDNYRMIS